MKRYQHCPWYQRLWRRRHYLYIPVTAFRLHDKRFEGEDEPLGWRHAWSLAVGTAQFKMRWWYTLDEIE